MNTLIQSKLNYEFKKMDENCNEPCRRLNGSLIYHIICTRQD